jgi:PTS system mannose-specific IIA component
MIGIIVLTHGNMARELVRVAEVISGPVELCEAISFPWETSFNEGVRIVKEAIERLDTGDGVLILTDMYGDTPSNIAMQFLDKGRVEVVTGVNLPMLLRLVISSRNDARQAEFIDWLVDKARRGIQRGSHVTEPQPASNENSTIVAPKRTEPEDPNAVFLSYRHKENWSIALAIRNDLMQHDYRPFMDIDITGPGEFDSFIQKWIVMSPYFLLLLSVGSTERLLEPDDPMRLEIETAIDLNRRIIPILIDDFEFRSVAAHFTGKLKNLPKLNGVHLRREYFEESMDRLRNKFLKSP